MQERYQSNRIKILYIVTLSELGGAQKHLFYHLKYLNKSAYNPILAAGQDDWLIRQAEAMNIKTYFCKNLIRSINPINDFKAFFELLKIIKSEKPDIVHCHSSKAGIIGRIAAWIAGVPVIMFTAHGWAFTEGVSKTNRAVYRFIEKYAAMITTKIIAVSGYDYRLAERYNVAGKDKMALIKNGIDFNRIDNDDLKQSYRKELNIEDSKKVVTMVSRLSPQKDPISFLKLAKLNGNSDTVFLLVGGGPLMAKMQTYIENNNIQNVRLMGDRNDVERILAVSDIFCFFSNYEGLPLAVIEAMAAGLPVIANPVGGVPELVKDGVNGFLVDKGNISAANDKLQPLVKDYIQREKMGNESRKMYLEFFTTARMAKETEEIYRKLHDSTIKKTAA